MLTSYIYGNSFYFSFPFELCVYEENYKWCIYLSWWNFYACTDTCKKRKKTLVARHHTSHSGGLYFEYKFKILKSSLICVYLTWYSVFHFPQ